MRLDKLLAHTGFGTRKQVKKIIRDGYITVNGAVNTVPKTKVEPDTDDVRIGGEKIVYEKYVYYMLNKPGGVISATEDGFQSTVLDLFEPSDLVQKIHPIGRLDLDTEGLLFLTNDGQLTHHLTSPRREVRKKYYVEVDGTLSDENIKALEDGVLIEDGSGEEFLTLPATVKVLSVSEAEGKSTTEITIHEGKFHQVKRMFEAVGCSVTYLKRIQMGPITLDETLPLGEYRSLTQKEIDALKNA